MMTSGIAELIGDVGIFRNFRKRAELLRAIRGYDAFTRERPLWRTRPRHVRL
jgi:hypothetical protein